jgi:cholinesterase
MLQIFGLALLASAASAEQTWSVGQTVKASSGTVKGHASSWKPAVSEYLGIPFAQPPVGPLRFKAPVPLKSDKLLNATSFGASCPANVDPGKTKSISYDGPFSATLLAGLGQVEDKFDEDCLTLNIWSKPQTGEKKKAVMVWIYGGGFGSGSTSYDGYNGARLADEHDVTVVSINYRVNIFGFPRGDFLTDQNLGLLDQRAGVEWVRDK